ncbi:MAG: hypothetical protein CYG61_09195 [Actinobacteria bacterium]|nr:MAG: hypothetical protein CYG61_09195 [Actinomycetota bacterium]
MGATIAMAVALATLAACGGDSGGGAEDGSPTIRGQAASSSTTAVPATASGGEAATTAPVAGSAAATTTAGGARRATSTTSTSRAEATGGAAAAPAPSGAAATRPGRYRYASTGTFSAGLTGEQRRSGESVLIVDPPAGADQHSLREGDNRSTEQVLRFQADGIYIVVLEVTEQGLAKEFRPSPPVLAFPYGAAAGRTWSWRMTSTDGKTTVEGNLRIERTESVQVGSDAVPAVVVRAALATTGDIASRGTQTLWVAEGRRLVVREQSRTEGSFGAISFRSTAEEQLLSLGSL